MNHLCAFLKAEVVSQEMYNKIIGFIISPHIRNGKFLGNKYTVQKINQANYNLYIEGMAEGKLIEITQSSFYQRDSLIEGINQYALSKGMILSEILPLDRYFN